MPLKPVKHGIKVWILGDSLNGYFSRFDVYTGKKGNAAEVGNATEVGLGARVVKELTSDMQGKYHHIYFDNFFTSQDLLLDLVAKGIYACGTARTNRKGFPQLLKDAKLKERYHMYPQSHTGRHHPNKRTCKYNVK